MINLKEHKTLSEIDKSTDIAYKMLKLGEESGEAQSAYLAYAKAPNASKSETGTFENLIEEVIDCILVSYDILNKLNVKEEIIKEISDRKLKKWENKLLK